MSRIEIDLNTLDFSLQGVALRNLQSLFSSAYMQNKISYAQPDLYIRFGEMSGPSFTSVSAEANSNGLVVLNKDVLKIDSDGGTLFSHLTGFNGSGVKVQYDVSIIDSINHEINHYLVPLGKTSSETFSIAESSFHNRLDTNLLINPDFAYKITQQEQSIVYADEFVFRSLQMVETQRLFNFEDPLNTDHRNIALQALAANPFTSNYNWSEFTSLEIYNKIKAHDQTLLSFLSPEMAAKDYSFSDFSYNGPFLQPVVYDYGDESMSVFQSLSMNLNTIYKHILYRTDEASKLKSSIEWDSDTIGDNSKLHPSQISIADGSLHYDAINDIFEGTLKYESVFDGQEIPAFLSLSSGTNNDNRYFHIQDDMIYLNKDAPHDGNHYHVSVQLEVFDGYTITRDLEIVFNPDFKPSNSAPIYNETTPNTRVYALPHVYDEDGIPVRPDGNQDLHYQWHLEHEGTVSNVGSDTNHLDIPFSFVGDKLSYTINYIDNNGNHDTVESVSQIVNRPAGTGSVVLSGDFTLGSELKITVDLSSPDGIDPNSLMVLWRGNSPWSDVISLTSDPLSFTHVVTNDDLYTYPFYDFYAAVVFQNNLGTYGVVLSDKIYPNGNNAPVAGQDQAIELTPGETYSGRLAQASDPNNDFFFYKLLSDHDLPGEITLNPDGSFLLHASGVAGTQGGFDYYVSDYKNNSYVQHVPVTILSDHELTT